MNLPLTFGVLVALTGFLVWFCFYWPRVPHRVQRILIALACFFPALSVFEIATQWSTASIRVNAGFYWLAVAGYEFLLILFTRLKPRWLTTMIAVILILPLLSASAFLPLTDLFTPPPATRADLGRNMYSERTPWGSGSVASRGTDLGIYYRPPWAPFLRRRRQSCRYFGGQCDAWSAFAELEPDGKNVMMACPADRGNPASSAHHFVVPLK
jgi:hypothetical protein